LAHGWWSKETPLPFLFAEMVRTQHFVPVDWNKQDYRVAHWLISLIHFRAMLGFSSAYGPTDVQSQFHHEQTSLHIYLPCVYRL
jgi:bacteriorhodopsin